MRIAVLTSGGDAPGMNAVIRAVVKVASSYGIEVFGIMRGFVGLIEDQISPLTLKDVDNIAEIGGSILKSARTDKFYEDFYVDRAAKNLKNKQIDGLIVVGGDGSFKGAAKLSTFGVNVVGIPGTIDNDLQYTNFSIGFDTALNTVLDAISRIKDTGSTHEKGTIVEVMGRNCGDLALHSALSGAAEIISTPEKRLSHDEIAFKLKKNIVEGKSDNIVIITENMYSMDELRSFIEKKLDIGIRKTSLGFIQRGGKPSAFDRSLAGKMSIRAVELLKKGISGRAIGMRDYKIIDVSFEDIANLHYDKEEDYNSLNLLI
ncbi:MAG: ATP-dependent 6-phosphofructokinase [Fusobacteriaceae bacterium]